MLLHFYRVYDPNNPDHQALDENHMINSVTGEIIVVSDEMIKEAKEKEREYEEKMKKEKEE